jgi:hypothetical protein
MKALRKKQGIYNITIVNRKFDMWQVLLGIDLVVSALSTVLLWSALVVAIAKGPKRSQGC